MFASNKYDGFVIQVNTFKIPEIKSDLIAMSVAAGLAAMLSLPTAPVETPRAYFNENCASVVLTYVSEVNERLIIDVGLVRELTYAFWLDRYSALNRAEYMRQLFNVAAVGSYLDFIRPSLTMFTPDQLTILQENGRLILDAAIVFMASIEIGVMARETGSSAV